MKFRSPVTKPLLRANTPLPADRRSVFRVTQQFNSRDFYWNDGRTHSAVDIGDLGCGSPLVAMADGVGYRIKDNASQIQAGATDALGYKIDHGIVDGARITTEVWHMGGYTAGDRVPIKAGQQIGVVGDTGLGAICHAHVEAKRNGVKFDPEPLMFGGSIGSQESDMRFGGEFKPINERFKTLAGANFRADTTLAAAVLKSFPAGVSVLANGRTTAGDAANGSTEWLTAWMYVAPAYVLGAFHSSALEAVSEPATLVQGEPVGSRAAGFADAKVKAKVAIDGIRP